ncbi:hypothetical protein SEPCBS119000_001413 [Sporothrix epigloea]|uniref:Uncharacterized protein n=1 Tax=Sporothrix epigloea TaxID=1892477 RepID=A0ABP0DBQ2_9PEZI
MGTTLSAIKTLLLPALAALLVFVLFSFIVVPIWQHYRNRYSHYLPLGTLSGQTMTLRDRMQSSLSHFFARASTSNTGREYAATSDGTLGIGDRIRSLLRRGGIVGAGPNRNSGGEQGVNDNELLSDDEDLNWILHDSARGLSLGEAGEELGPVRPERRQELSRNGASYDQRRLSRELEQGFMDDSDDDEPPRR